MESVHYSQSSDYRVPFTGYGQPQKAIARNRGEIKDVDSVGTSFIITGGLMLTAGHCFEVREEPEHSGKYYWVMDFVEFDVPLSKMNGYPLPSGNKFSVARDVDSKNKPTQNPINPYTIYSEETQIRGDDWCVYELKKRDVPDSISKQSAIEAQKAFFRLTDEFNIVDSPEILRIAGYGTTLACTTPFRQRSYTFQITEGKYTNEVLPTSGSVHNIMSGPITVDGGNSGSPVFQRSSNLAVGILADGQIIGSDSYSVGFKNTDLQKKIMEKLHVNILVDPGHPSQKENGSIVSPYKSLQKAINDLKNRDKIGIVSPSTISYKNALEIPLGVKILALGYDKIIFAIE